MTNPNGRFGIHGGQYMPETLINAVKAQMRKGEPPRTASGGCFAGGFGAPGKLSSGQFSVENGRQPREVNRNKRSVRGTVAPIEIAQSAHLRPCRHPLS